MKTTTRLVATGTLLLGLTVPTITLADDVSGIQAALEKIHALLLKIATTTAKSSTELLYEQDPSMPASMASTLGQTKAKQASALLAEQALAPQIKQELLKEKSPPDVSVLFPGSKNGKMSLIPPTTLSLASLAASDHYQQRSFAAPLDFLKRITGTETAMAAADEGNANFTFSSLLGPTTYSPDAFQHAYYFVQYAARTDIPLANSALGWSKLSDEQKQKMLTTSAGQAYRVGLRSLIANRSAGLNSLYSLITERVPQTSLANAIPGQKSVSPYAMQQYMATHRTNNPEWYQEVAKASPAALARQQVIIAAETQRLLFQLHQDNERILASLAMIQLVSAQQQALSFKETEMAAQTALGIAGAGTPSPEELMRSMGTPPAMPK